MVPTKTFLFVADFFASKYFPGTWFLKCFVNSVFGVNQKVDFTKGSKLLPTCALNESALRIFDLMEDEHSVLHNDTSTKEKEVHNGITSPEVTMSKHITLPFCTKSKYRVRMNIYLVSFTQKPNATCDPGVTFGQLMKFIKWLRISNLTL